MAGVISAISLCIFIVCLSHCSSKNLPSFIQKCKQDYPEVNECLIQRVKDLKPYIENGIPELKLPALKPLRIPKAEIQTGNGFSATFTDIVIEHAEDFQVKKLDFNLRKKIIDMRIYIPKLHIHSTYNFNGKILVLELSGTGPADTNITNVNAETHSNVNTITKDGKQYLDIGDNKPTITYDKPSLRFEDLFKGNDELTKHTNQVINENIEEIQKEIKPLIDDTIHKFVHGVIKSVFDEYSLDELFD